MADMQELIARLEAAEGPDRALDREIGLRIDGWYETVDSHGECLMVNGDRYPDHPESEYPSFTESLDAALALAERVLPDWAWEIRLDRGGASVQAAPVWWMEGLAAPDEGGVSCDGKTPALALCIAILKAKAQGEGG